MNRDALSDSGSSTSDSEYGGSRSRSRGASAAKRSASRGGGGASRTQQPQAAAQPRDGDVWSVLVQKRVQEMEERERHDRERDRELKDKVRKDLLTQMGEHESRKREGVLEKQRDLRELTTDMREWEEAQRREKRERTESQARQRAVLQDAIQDSRQWRAKEKERGWAAAQVEIDTFNKRDEREVLKQREVRRRNREAMEAARLINEDAQRRRDEEKEREREEDARILALYTAKLDQQERARTEALSRIHGAQSRSEARYQESPEIEARAARIRAEEERISADMADKIRRQEHEERKKERRARREARHVLEEQHRQAEEKQHAREVQRQASVAEYQRTMQKVEDDTRREREERDRRAREREEYRKQLELQAAGDASRRAAGYVLSEREMRYHLGGLSLGSYSPSPSSRAGGSPALRRDASGINSASAGALPGVRRQDAPRVDVSAPPAYGRSGYRSAENSPTSAGPSPATPPPLGRVASPFGAVARGMFQYQ